VTSNWPPLYLEGGRSGRESAGARSSSRVFFWGGGFSLPPAQSTCPYSPIFFSFFPAAGLWSDLCSVLCGPSAIHRPALLRSMLRRRERRRGGAAGLCSEDCPALSVLSQLLCGAEALPFSALICAQCRVFYLLYPQPNVTRPAAGQARKAPRPPCEVPPNLVHRATE
jgi:hypothetical protein